jgi:hypothetical protein
MASIANLAALLRTMQPTLNRGTYVFASVPDGQVLPVRSIVASIREAEGLSVVIEESAAQEACLSTVFRCAWITLSVNSDLETVGLTAAFSSALANASISCNVVAGLNHDHIFVPVGQAELALEVLRTLQVQQS